MGMEYIYEFKNKRMTLSEFKNDIINDYVNTNKLKKELKEIYPVSTETLAKVLKGIKKLYCECTNCGEKDKNNFYKKNNSLCKKCIGESQSNKYINLSEDKKNEKIEKQKKWIINNLIKVRVHGAKNRAKRKNIDFDIDEKYIENLLIEQDYKCRYSGVQLELTIGSENSHINPNTISIDRINPKFGYIKGNINLVTAFVNSMKNDSQEDDFLMFINLICENFKK